MKNLIIGGLVLGILGYGGSKLYLHNEVSNAMDQAVILASPFAKIEYDGVSSSLLGKLTIDALKVRVSGYRDEIYIDRLGIDTPSYFALLDLFDPMQLQQEGFPDYLGFIIEGLRIPVNADYFADLYEFALEANGVKEVVTPAAECTGKYGFSPKALAALGYRDQIMDLSMYLRDENSRFAFDMTVNMQNMYDLKADIWLAGNVMTELMKGPAYRPKLGSMRVEYTDRSLNSRVVDYCERLGLSPLETLRAQVDSFKYIGENNGIEFDQYMLDPYKEFLKGKKTLVVTARPNDPIAFSQIDLYKPSDVPALLNLAAAAR